MKNLCKLMLILCGLVLVYPQAFAKDPKIAVADNLTALLKSNEAKKMLEGLQAELEEDKTKIQAIESKLKDLNEKAERDGPVMSKSQQDKLLQEIEDQSIDRNFLIKKYQKRQQEGQQQIIQALKPKFEMAINEVVEEGKYDIVLHKQAVVFSATAYDITEEITRKLNSAKSK